MLCGPIVQVAEQYLEIEHDLVFLQMALPTEGFCVNGIACSLSLCELTLQGRNAGQVLSKTLPKRSLALQETVSGFFSPLAE